MPTLTIEGKAITVPDGTTVLQAAQRLGIEVPTFCSHPGLSIAGNCRMCLVEIEKQPRLAASCSVPVAEGMVVHVHSKKAKDGRQAVIEFLLGNHPLDCPICDRAGECVLQDNAMGHGVLKSRFEPPKRHKPKVVDIGRHVVLDAERCIMCSRCVRFVDEVSKSHELGIFGRGNSEQIGLAPGKRLDNPYSGNVVDLCPVGALTAKEFRFQSRAWFLTKTNSVCPSCARGCNITVDANPSAINKVGTRRVYRFMPRLNADVNGHWMCDEGRFRFAFVDAARVTAPVTRTGGATAPLAWDAALAECWRALSSVDPQRVGVLLSRGSSLEDLYLAREFCAAHLKGAAVAVDAPSERPPTADDFLVQADKWPNTAGARALGLDGPGAEWVEILRRAAKRELDVLLVVGHDLSSIYMPSDVDAALHWLKALIVLAQNEHSTVARASLVLPVANFTERDGTWVNSAGRVQRFHQAFDSLGAAVPEWRIWKELLGRAGSPALYRDAASVFRQLAEGTSPFRG
ncbi:MAG: 2Fe-2S iron-sulfur cluster-binding protein, partial [bacterium]